MISGWLRDTEFQATNGAPLDLPMYGETASFASLVKRYSGDVRAGAIFDELLRVRAIEKIDERVRLLTEGYIPRHGKDEKIRIMGICAADLLNTLEYNLTQEGDAARFQRAVVYRDLPEPIARQFEKISREKTSEVLVELNQWLAGKKNSAESNSSHNDNKKIGLGIYYFEDSFDGDTNGKK